MKHVISFLLCAAIVLCLACTGAKTDAPSAEATGLSMIVVDPVPETTPAGGDDHGAPVLTDPPAQASQTPTPDTPAPDPQVAPDLSMLPIAFHIDWDRTEQRLITFDIDFDGEEETIS